MKKLLVLLILPLLAVTLNSCSKDDGGDDGGKDNQLTINGQTHEFVGGNYWYYDDDSSILLSLETKAGICIDFDDMFVPAGNTKLVAGTYKYNNSHTAFTFSYGEIYNDNIEYEETITGGTITISISGSTYTINLNCTLSGGGTAKGTYKGTLTASN